MYIHDQSSQPKLLVLCTTEELFEEREHRKALLSDERWRKTKKIGLFWLIAGSCLALAAVYFYVVGKEKIVPLLLGLGGLALVLVTSKVTDEPTEFELRQLGALKEIHHILRERGVE
ncbi:hypothetical protein WT60_24370 [Burkholderia sp. MSMB617WGS]|nr:hypothetical protein WS86_24280 [Burkholderia savannae]AOK49994.1 hypothetical protein WT60_24370 [Burkholderia sp. MSMB617WGS]